MIRVQKNYIVCLGLNDSLICYLEKAIVKYKLFGIFWVPIKYYNFKKNAPLKK